MRPHKLFPRHAEIGDGMCDMCVRTTLQFMHFTHTPKSTAQYTCEH